MLGRASREQVGHCYARHGSSFDEGVGPGAQTSFPCSRSAPQTNALRTAVSAGVPRLSTDFDEAGPSHKEDTSMHACASVPTEFGNLHLSADARHLCLRETGYTNRSAPLPDYEGLGPAEGPSPYLRHDGGASPQVSAWLTPTASTATAQDSFFPGSPDCHLQPAGTTSPNADAQYADGVDTLATRSQSSHSSLPATAGLMDPELVEPSWVIDRELQTTIVQALVDEQQTPIDPDYMQYHGRDVQQDGDWITPSMRYMTVTWMSEAIDDLHLTQAVCCMSITLLDRYLSAARAFPRSMLQLAAGTCMFVATKIEGMLPHPPASAFVALAAGAFELDDIVLFERILCQTLGFNLCAPTVHNFLTLFESTLGDPGTPLVEYMREHTHHMACYLLELALCSFEMLRTPRHVLAVSALILAYSDRGIWRHVADSGEVRYELVERYAMECVESFRQHFGPDIHVNAVAQCCGEILRLVRVSANTMDEPFVVQKFRMPKYGSVARISSPMTTEEFQRVMIAYVNQGSP